MAHGCSFPPLVALVGHKGSGKSTLCTLLEQDLDYSEVAIADTLKKAICGLFVGFVCEEDVTDPSRKNCFNAAVNTTNRRVMQRMGDMVREQIPLYLPEMFELSEHKGRSLCIITAAKEIKDFLSAGIRVCVSDCRFPDEIKMIRELGGVVVRIVRPEATQSSTSDDQHASETSLDDEKVEDFVLVNNGSVNSLLLKFSQIEFNYHRF